MSISSIAAMYFSPTGTMKRNVSHIAESVADEICRDNVPALLSSPETPIRFHVVYLCCREPET